MEREIWFGFAVPGLILLTLRAAQADAVVYVDPGGFGRGPRFARGGASPKRVRITLVGVGYDGPVRVERT